MKILLDTSKNQVTGGCAGDELVTAVKVKHRLAKKDIRPLLEEPEDPSAENEMAEAILLRLVIWYILRLTIDIGCSCV